MAFDIARRSMDGFRLSMLSTIFALVLATCSAGPIVQPSTSFRGATGQSIAQNQDVSTTFEIFPKDMPHHNITAGPLQMSKRQWPGAPPTPNQPTPCVNFVPTMEGVPEDRTFQLSNMIDCRDSKTDCRVVARGEPVIAKTLWSISGAVDVGLVNIKRTLYRHFFDEVILPYDGLSYLVPKGNIGFIAVTARANRIDGYLEGCPSAESRTPASVSVLLSDFGTYSVLLVDGL